MWFSEANHCMWLRFGSDHSVLQLGQLSFMHGHYVIILTVTAARVELSILHFGLSECNM